MIGYDRLSGGTGEMRWRLADLVPVVSADGPDVTRSAAGRLASEIALLPTAFGGATWTGGEDADTAVACWGVGADQQRLGLHLGPDGRLRSVFWWPRTRRPHFVGSNGTRHPSRRSSPEPLMSWLICGLPVYVTFPLPLISASKASRTSTETLPLPEIAALEVRVARSPAR